MPATLLSPAARWLILALAATITSRSVSSPRGGISSAWANSSVVMRDAISPAWAPPIPSATMNSGSRIR